MIRPASLTIEDGARLVDAAAGFLAARIRQCLEARGACDLALAGGRTPRSVYARLAEPDLSATIRWDLVSFYFGDERCVPPDHPDSNYRMAREALLDRVPVAPAQVHPILCDDEPEAAALAYEQVLPDSFDLLLLGMGADGHTASLFPGSPATQELRRRVVPAEAPDPPIQRVTVTPAVIAAARRPVIIVTGAAKAAAVARALNDEYAPQALPIQFARRGDWFLDRAAAAGLAGSTA
jgi:6-phosphogluconolactonase